MVIRISPYSMIVNKLKQRIYGTNDVINFPKTTMFSKATSDAGSKPKTANVNILDKLLNVSRDFAQQIYCAGDT